jgi:hypothetical protein
MDQGLNYLLVISDFKSVTFSQNFVTNGYNLQKAGSNCFQKIDTVNPTDNVIIYKRTYGCHLL